MLSRIQRFPRFENQICVHPANRHKLLRAALAKVLMVSLSTVDRMLADGEITPIRLRGKLVRFHVPDVLAELREKANTSKRNYTRKL
jgi:excisionase family DNA binding protein